jgi:hypothetical protein
MQFLADNNFAFLWNIHYLSNNDLPSSLENYPYIIKPISGNLVQKCIHNTKK